MGKRVRAAKFANVDAAGIQRRAAPLLALGRALRNALESGKSSVGERKAVIRDNAQLINNKSARDAVLAAYRVERKSALPPRTGCGRGSIALSTEDREFYAEVRMLFSAAVFADVRCATCQVFVGYKLSLTENNCVKQHFCGYKCTANNKTVRTRRENTMIKRYGVLNASQATHVKRKKEQTTLKNYGVSNPSKSASIQKKKEVTSVARYGTRYPGQSDVIKDKARTTNLERYGVEYTGSVPERIMKIRDTWKNKSPNEVRRIKEAQEATMVKRYGVRSPMHVPELYYKYLAARGTKSIQLGKHLVENLEGHELDALKTLYRSGQLNGKSLITGIDVGSFEYTKSGKTHVYYPDFRVDDVYVEVKCSFTWNSVRSGGWASVKKKLESVVNSGNKFLLMISVRRTGSLGWVITSDISRVTLKRVEAAFAKSLSSTEVYTWV